MAETIFCLFSATSTRISFSSISGTRFIVCSFCFIFFYSSSFISVQRVGKKVDEHTEHTTTEKRRFFAFSILLFGLFITNFLSVFLPLSCLFSMFFSYLHTSTERFFYNTYVHNVITVRKLFCDGTLDMKKNKTNLIFFCVWKHKVLMNSIPNRHWQGKPNKQQILRVASKYEMKIFMIQNTEMQRTQPKNIEERSVLLLY